MSNTCCGTYNSKQDFIEQYVIDMRCHPGPLAMYFDFEALGRDLMMDYSTYTDAEGNFIVKDIEINGQHI